MDQVITFLSDSGEMIYPMILIAIIVLGGITLVKQFQEDPREEPPPTPGRTTEVPEEEKRRALKRLGIDPNDPNRRPDRW